ncbi:MAG: SGNH/GDSL hydrolase family protein, partial [Melioribacteraceae bacterium]
LEDEHAKNYFNVIIDGENISLLHPDSTKEVYTLASNLEEGIHTAELFKRTEWSNGKTKFYGFQIDQNAKILDIEPKEKSIEFYGNSITAGYANEDYSGNDSPDGINTNNYYSYAALTARHFNANYSCIAKGGIGITVSWFPMIMKEMFYRLNPEDENSIWEFNKSKPDIVVINILQNDSWLVNRPEHEQFKNRFGTKKPTKEFIISAYNDFVKSIRSKYTNAKIICMLGNMDITKEGSVWPSYVEEAVSVLNDKNVYTLFVPYKITDGHPKVEEQKVMADELIKFIENNFWMG